MNMEFTENKSALILEADDNGEITVNVASADIDSLPEKICAAMAKKTDTGCKIPGRFDGNTGRK